MSMRERDVFDRILAALHRAALDDARWIVARLRRMDDGSFRTFPLRPLRTRSS